MEDYIGSWQNAILVHNSMSTWTVCRPRNPCMKVWPGSPEKEPWQDNKGFSGSLSQARFQRDLQPFTKLTVHWGRENHQTLWGLLDMGSLLTLILLFPVSFVLISVLCFLLQWLLLCEALNLDPLLELKQSQPSTFSKSFLSYSLSI